MQSGQLYYDSVVQEARQIQIDPAGTVVTGRATLRYPSAKSAAGCRFGPMIRGPISGDMRLGTRLLLLLLPVATLIMCLYALWALNDREANLARRV